MFYRDVRPDNCGIYMIKNISNGKQYIGQSHNIRWRWTSHRSALRSNRCANRHLQSAWNKYGEDQFEFEIIELCDVKELDRREEYWIEKYDTTNTGYNIRAGGNSSRGWKMSEDARKHLSNALKGKKKPEWMGRYISERQKKYYQTHIPSASKVVVCLNTGEHFVNATKANIKYPSANISALHAQCKGKTRSCGKSADGEHLVWAYLEDYAKMTTDEIKFRLHFVGSAAISAKNHKPVRCLNTDIVFDSCRKAAEYAGISPATLNDCLSGRQKHAGHHPETNERLSWAYEIV